MRIPIGCAQEIGNLPLASFCLVNEYMKGCQVSCAANQDRANDWLIA